MQVCTSLQTDNHASTPPLSFFRGQMPFLLPNQHQQSTEGKVPVKQYVLKVNLGQSLKFCTYLIIRKLTEEMMVILRRNYGDLNIDVAEFFCRSNACVYPCCCLILRGSFCNSSMVFHSDVITASADTDDLRSIACLSYNVT